MNANEVKKDLYKSKNMAKFSHYVSGNLYYTVDLTTGRFQFPIPVVEKETKFYTFEEGNVQIENVLKLSEDLGTTTFENEIKGSDLNRWISKAIDKGEFIEIKTGGLNLTKLSVDIDNILNSISPEERREWLDKQIIK